MKATRLGTVIAVSLLLATPALLAAQPPQPSPQQAGDDPLARHLFPPELVMARQREIGLQPAQRQQISQAIGRLQARVLELQWTVQEQQEALSDLLSRPQVDSAAALAAMDRLLTTEREVKRAHMALLIQIKNALTPEQQQRLRAAQKPPDLSPGIDSTRRPPSVTP